MALQKAPRSNQNALIHSVAAICLLLLAAAVLEQDMLLNDPVIKTAVNLSALAREGVLEKVILAMCMKQTTPPAAARANKLPMRLGRAVTTRALADPNPTASPQCEVPEGTRLTFQWDNPSMGKSKLLVPSNAARAANHCATSVVVDRDAVKSWWPPVEHVTETSLSTPAFATVTAESVNLMTRATSNGDIIAPFPRGTRVRILGHVSNGAVRVSVESNLSPQQLHQLAYSAGGIYSGFMAGKSLKIDSE